MYNLYKTISVIPHYIRISSMAAKPLLIYSILLIEKILLIKNSGEIFLSHKWASHIDKI